ncbi:hypothetical protein Q644_14810 [Brucella intermedia 229E]|uniref:Uncharacterized protein n=1 Tax=Brucella intermedia 229E TaxID=1337887 RepID=U4VIS5_9HYPH|nr:hypothetical protein Q644_14810 [Brucella intermedia 229E]
MAKTHDHAEKIDWQKKVDAEGIGVGYQIAEQTTDKRFQNPGQIEGEPEGHIPGEGDWLAGFRTLFDLRILDVHQNEKSQRLLP